MVHDGIRKEKICPAKDCFFSTSSNKDLNRHIRKHTGIYYFCKSYILAVQMFLMMKIIFFFHSSLCRKGIRFSYCLYYSSTGEKPYRCDDCGTCFSRGDKLKVHRRIHTNSRPYLCDEPGCQYRAIDSGSLRKHKRTHTNERPYR